MPTNEQDKFCVTCQLPLAPSVARLFCSYGCFLADRVARQSRGINYLIFGLSSLFFIFLLLTTYFSSLLPVAVPSWLGLTGALVVTFLLAFPLFRWIFAGLGSGHLALAEVLITGALLVGWGIELGGASPSFAFPLTLVVAATGLGLVSSRCRKLAGRDMVEVFNLRPQKAFRLAKNQPVETKPSDLRVGDMVQVQAGGIIPCDGVILQGTTSVDESVFTAENTVLLKGKGDRVKAASLNRDGTIVVKMDGDPSGHFLEKFIHAASGVLRVLPKPSLFFRLPFRIGFIACFIVAFLIFLFLNPKPFHLAGLTLAGGIGLLGFYEWLGFFSPFVVAQAAGGLAAQGILLGSGILFSKLADLDSLFFEKTGILTRGEYRFSQIYLEQGTNQGLFLSAIFSLEAHSNHPLARGMKTHPWYVEFFHHAVTEFKSYAGLGISGMVCPRGMDSSFVAVGNTRFLKRLQMQISRPLREKVEELELVGETVILCGWDGEAKGLMSFADTLREDVKPLMTGLRRLGIEPVMITADHEEMMAHLSYAHGLKQMYTRCLPEEKNKKVKNYRDKGACVGVVADTRNSGEIFAEADVGIVFDAEDDLPLGRADVFIVGKKLTKISHFVDYGRRVAKILRIGSHVGFGIMGLILSLVVVGLMDPVIGTLMGAVAVSSFFVLVLDLRKKKTV